MRPTQERPSAPSARADLNSCLAFLIQTVRTERTADNQKAGLGRVLTYDEKPVEQSGKWKIATWQRVATPSTKHPYHWRCSFQSFP